MVDVLQIQRPKDQSRMEYLHYGSQEAEWHQITTEAVQCSRV